MPGHLSYWERTAFLGQFDVLVIGGGIVGCSAALATAAAHPGLRIGVVERGSIPDGASSRNAGFACFGSISEICQDIAEMGEETALDLVLRRHTGLKTLLHLLTPEAIRYQQTGGFEIFTTKDEESYQHCRQAMDALNQLLEPSFGGAVFVENEAVSTHMGLTDVAHVIRLPYEGILHPGMMMKAFWERLHDAGITILSGVTVTAMRSEDRGVVIETGLEQSLYARYAIVATNAYAAQMFPELPVRPSRNQVYLTQPVPGLKLRGCFHYDHGYVYFRNVEDRLLIGGARNADFEGEATDVHGLTDLIRKELYAFVKAHLLHDTPFSFEEAWSGIIATGPQKGPIIDIIDERIVVAVRLGGMGVAIGSLVGAEAARRILAV